MEQQKTRRLRFKDPEFRAVTEEDGARRIRGYPIIFGVPGFPYWESDWTEVVDPNALADVDLSGLYLFVEHDARMILAKNGVNLRAEVDKTGLFIEATLGNTALDDYAFDRVSKGIIDGMSFSFFADVITTDSTMQQDRIMHITTLLETSLVAWPAYEATVALASADQRHRDAETEASKERDKADAALALELALIG